VWKWNFVEVGLNDIVQLNGGNGINTKWWKVEKQTKLWKWNFVEVSLNDIVQLNGGSGNGGKRGKYFLKNQFLRMDYPRKEGR